MKNYLCKNLSGIIITDHFDKLTFNALQSLNNVCKEIIIVVDYDLKGDLNFNYNFIANIKLIRPEIKLNHSQMRNLGLINCDTDWVFILDSDEILSDVLISNIPKLLKNYSIDGFLFSRRNYVDNVNYLKHGLFYPDYQLRLFKNKEIFKFTGPIHPHINIEVKNTKLILHDIYHYPRNQKYSKFSDFKNFLPYIKIEAEDLIKDDRIAMWYLLNAFYKSTTIFLSAYFRGKGFLDGWAGLRAHLIFAFYIFYLNFTVGLSKLLRKNILE